MLMKFSRFDEIQLREQFHVAQIALEKKTPTENHPSRYFINRQVLFAVRYHFRRMWTDKVDRLESGSDESQNKASRA